MQDFQRFIEKLCSDHNLVIQEKFAVSEGVYAALNNDGVYKVLDSQGRSLVLKIAITENSIAEIKMNEIGYQKLRDYGLDWFIPEVSIIEVNERFAVMLMEYCGEDFLTQARKVKDPLRFYSRLLDELVKVYTQSKRKSDEGKQMVTSIIELILEQYEKYIYIHLDEGRTLESRLGALRSSVNINKIEFCCFSSWDFVPENIFLTPIGLKYIDPHEDVIGIPVIDIACFAGLMRLYGLPEADKGYAMFQEFALTKIPSILNISEKSACKLFLLGKVLQSFLSARFRINSNLIQAQKIFLEGKTCLEKII